MLYDFQNKRISAAYFNNWPKINKPGKPGLTGLCPICGEWVCLIGLTTNDRFIGSCLDAFSPEQWANFE